MNLLNPHGGSSLYRVALCPGSPAAEDGLPETTSEYARKGNECHEYMKWWTLSRASIWSEQPTANLDEDQSAFVSLCEQRLTDLAAQHGGVRRVLVEHGIDDGNGVSHPDFLVEMVDATFHLFDYKSGWAELDAPCENAQLRIYAVLASKVWPAIVERGLYAYIMNRYKMEPVFFTPGSFAAYQKEIDEIIQASQKPDAPRIPGAMQCKYCKAYQTARCPESQNLPAVMHEQIPATVEALQALPAVTVEHHYDLWKAIEPYGKLLKEEIKRRIRADPESIRLSLQSTGKTRSIDAMEIYKRLSDVPDEVIFQGLALATGKMKEALADFWGVKQAQAEEKMLALFGDALTETEKEPKIARKK